MFDQRMDWFAAMRHDERVAEAVRERRISEALATRHSPRRLTRCGKVVQGTLAHQLIATGCKLLPAPAPPESARVCLDDRVDGDAPSSLCLVGTE